MKGKRVTQLSRQLLRVEEKNAHIFIHTYIYTRERTKASSLINDGRKEGLFSALRNSRAFIPAINVGTWFVLSVIVSFRKRCFAATTKRETGPKKKKTQLSQNVLIPLLSSILFSGCLHSISLCLSNFYDSLFLANSLLSIIKVYPSICLLPPYLSLSPNSAPPLSHSLSLSFSILLCRGSTYWTRQLHTIFLYRFLKSALQCQEDHAKLTK